MSDTQQTSDLINMECNITAIVKNPFGDTVSYDIQMIENQKLITNVSLENLKKYTLKNANLILGKYPYIKTHSPVPIRVITENIPLYHGSVNIIKKPSLRGGKMNNDYGQGFYTTTVKERADEWALLMSEKSYCNIYTISTNNLKICNLDNYGALAWIAEVSKNRQSQTYLNDTVTKLFCDKYCVSLDDYDVIIGYRADDSFFAIIKSFMNNEITVHEVSQFFHEGHLGKQVFLKSEKAFKELTFINATRVEKTKLRYTKNNDMHARVRVQEALRQRHDDIIMGNVNLTSKMTISNCLVNNYVYNKETGEYYVQ